MLAPNSIDELVATLQKHPQVLAVGGRTKPPLSAVEGVELLSMKGLSGITQYEPSEYTFTALAGTPVKEVNETLAKRGQYLPFDPCLSESGATLGGTVAAGTSGAGRFRFGGIRDFLIGIRFVDGRGQLLTGGGKVVKNAAGFDLPKLMVGSLGRFGVLAELTFKIFPKPESLLTLKIPCSSHGGAMERLVQLAGGRWELDALDYEASSRSLYARIGGPAAAVEELAGSLEASLDTEVTRMPLDEETRYWTAVSELSFAPSGFAVVKVPLTPKQFLSVQDQLDRLPDHTVHLSGGGAWAWLSIPQSGSLEKITEILAPLGIGGLVVKGPGSSIWVGHRANRAIDAAVKKALDPEERYPAF